MPLVISQDVSPHSYANLLQSEKFSDLVLKCQDQEFKVHKAVVCSQSPVLLAACDGKFMEAGSSVISVEFEPEMVKRMVKYLYTGNYDEDQPDDTESEEASKESAEDEAGEADEAGNTDGASSEVLNSDDPGVDSQAEKESMIYRSLLPHIKLNAIADYYAIPRLCYLANVEIQKILDGPWPPAGFSIVIEKAHDWTGDKGLHTILDVAAANHIEELVEAGENIPRIDVANSVIRKMIAADKNRREDYEGQIQGLLSRIGELGAAVDVAGKAERDMDSFKKLFNETTACKNFSCKAPLFWSMEMAGFGSYYMLRCLQCQRGYHG